MKIHMRVSSRDDMLGDGHLKRRCIKRQYAREIAIQQGSNFDKN